MSDPVTLAIATAAATGAATKLGDKVTEGTVALIRRLAEALTQRFGQDPEAQNALVAARFEGPEQQKAIATVAERLHRAEEDDPRIRDIMARLRPEVSQEGDGAVSNRIHGNVSGNARVYQGRDFHGDIRL
ncbi:hypothetical protein [Nocardiopsis sp. MG754419]|uniref:hypothetical protein n=1 Tax=Nocardiopsis sp. MG754419 TaxID=2259865 RepID=UPI001BA54333|nr:hypothetical protein [Nocardiopsis sp. MG754419]MBR8745111.1 hypothetical protein [Nocardiopsis sp. MG754419]